jgi:hypothetical protein
MIKILYMPVSPEFVFINLTVTTIKSTFPSMSSFASAYKCLVASRSTRPHIVRFKAKYNTCRPSLQLALAPAIASLTVGEASIP